MKSKWLLRIGAVLSAISCFMMIGAVIETVILLKEIADFGNVLDDPPDVPAEEVPPSLMRDMQIMLDRGGNALCLVVMAFLAVSLASFSLAFGGLKLRDELITKSKG